MQPTDTTAAERILADRARYVAPGATTPRLVVGGAEGARITDVDGREYVDFAGGIGCQNTGHRHPAVVDAIHAKGMTAIRQRTSVENPVKWQAFLDSGADGLMTIDPPTVVAYCRALP